MAQLTVVYWRDLPAQVIVKSGRKAAKRQLADRFQEAIDIAAMRGDARGTDAYLEEWRRSDPVGCGDDIETEADAHQQRIEAEYDDQRLKAIAKNGGRENGIQT